MTFPTGPSLSNLIVGVLVAVWIGVFAWIHGGYIGGALMTLVGLYEGYTIINAFPNDTLSESVWALEDGRPILPWIFGFATAYAMGKGQLGDPYVVLGIGFLSGHWFFQKFQVQARMAARVMERRVTRALQLANAEMYPQEVR